MGLCSKHRLILKINSSISKCLRLWLGCSLVRTQQHLSCVCRVVHKTSTRPLPALLCSWAGGHGGGQKTPVWVPPNSSWSTIALPGPARAGWQRKGNAMGDCLPRTPGHMPPSPLNKACLQPPKPGIPLIQLRLHAVIPRFLDPQRSQGCAPEFSPALWRIKKNVPSRFSSSGIFSVGKNEEIHFKGNNWMDRLQSEEVQVEGGRGRNLLHCCWRSTWPLFGCPEK